MEVSEGWNNLTEPSVLEEKVLIGGGDGMGIRESDTELKGKLDAYPVGKETVCYVDPEDKSIAVLRKDTKAALYSIWFPCLFVIGGLGMIATAIFRK